MQLAGLLPRLMASHQDSRCCWEAMDQPWMVHTIVHRLAHTAGRAAVPMLL